MSVDAHQHFWNLEREPLAWLTPEVEAIARTFEPAELEPGLVANGIERTVLVQAACTDSDTDAMLEQAGEHSWIGAVVAWVDLVVPEQARERLDELMQQPKVRGVRHAIHDEPDPRWLLQPAVLESIALLEARGLVLELPCVFPRHLDVVPELAAGFPNLPIVIDHLGKPPLGTESMGQWASLLSRAAAHDNVSAKVSGLNTMLANPAWTAADLRPAVEVAVDCFGAERLLCGSDWPVSLLNGSYDRVWQETVRVIEDVAPNDVDRLLTGTATHLYRLEPVSGGGPQWPPR